MNKLFALEIELIRKRFHIYGLFNIASLILVISLLLIGIKWLLAVIGNFERLAPLISVILLLLGQCDVALSEDKMLINLTRLRGFFPNLFTQSSRVYYSYRHFIVSIILIFFLLLPMEPNGYALYFYFYFSILLMITFLTTFAKNYMKKGLSDIIQNCSKIVFCLLIAMSMRGMLQIDLSKILVQINEFYSLIIVLLLLVLNIIVLYPKKKR